MSRSTRFYCSLRYFMLLSVLSLVGVPVLVFHYKTEVFERFEGHLIRDYPARFNILHQDSGGVRIVSSLEDESSSQKPHREDNSSKVIEIGTPILSPGQATEGGQPFENNFGSDRNGSCEGWPERPVGFVEVQPETLVYSAWYDDRKTRHYIRVLILSTTKLTPSTFCHFKGLTEKQTFTSEIEYYPHNENHHRHFGTFIGSCHVPLKLNTIPCYITISTTNNNRKLISNNTAVVPVGLIGKCAQFPRQSPQYSICIPPLHGEISVEWLVEFLELSQILGASHFTFYNFSVPESVKQSLFYYENAGLISLLPWNLPNYISKSKIHYFGQTLAVMDCLYRSMNLFDFVAFNDLDEFIVPLNYDNMSSMLQTIHKTQHSGYCFSSVIFDPTWERHDETAQSLLTQQLVSRTEEPVPMWTKCVVNPRRIFEQGIHHISKPIEEQYTPAQVDWNVARIFHYRRCQDPHAVWQPRCSGFQVDKTMHKFGEQLRRRFDIVFEHLSVNSM